MLIVKENAWTYSAGHGCATRGPPQIPNQRRPLLAVDAIAMLIGDGDVSSRVWQVFTDCSVAAVASSRRQRDSGLQRARSAGFGNRPAHCRLAVSRPQHRHDAAADRTDSRRADQIPNERQEDSFRLFFLLSIYG